MIGMVLAAGAGKRLRPDTDALPKALLPVDGDTTILDIGLRNLAAAGLAEVVIVVGYAAEVIADRVPELERAANVEITLIHNERALDWNNAYSLWLAREHFRRGVLLVNGDTVHPDSVQKSVLARVTQPAPPYGRLVIAVDDVKKLADEEMKVVFDSAGQLRQIAKQLDPGSAHGEYIGVTLIEPSAAIGLADSLEATWRRDPSLYYEDGFAEFARRGGAVLGAPIGVVDWVEVDNHADLKRAREIASRC
ncbi:MAG TPA: phosphocholine cytidylyltransferase family protein [Streptosporangiaceae bacterium]|nr:phosphocholine cytidylyltransferase family protein [Streptosporangiaceae bacterium]